MALSEEYRFISDSFGLRREVALKCNHFGVLAQVFSLLHRWVEVAITTDDDGGVVEITECADNDVDGHHDIHAFLDHCVALATMHPEFYL